MSVWRGYTKRFQKELTRYPQSVRASLLKQQNKYALPTMEQPMAALPQHERRRFDEVGVAAGDLAYVTEGPKKGTITRVLRYLPEYDGALLMDVTTKKIVPKSNWVENQTTHVFDFPELTPRLHFKLAAKDKDADGEVYYIVADDVAMRGRYYDARYRRWMPQRFVAHHDKIEIPWPTPEALPEGEDALGTTPDAALATTYELQTVAKPPVPPEALAQLRNPYLQYKRRYISEYQSRVVQAPPMPLLDAQRAYLAKKAITDAARARRMQPLSLEMQQYIGDRMARHLNQIDSPHLLQHLDDLSKVHIPDFALTQQKMQ
jgi:large subunit ribosomal protein L24